VAQLTQALAAAKQQAADKRSPAQITYLKPGQSVPPGKNKVVGFMTHNQALAIKQVKLPPAPPPIDDRGRQFARTQAFKAAEFRRNNPDLITSSTHEGARTYYRSAPTSEGITETLVRDDPRLPTSGPSKALSLARTGGDYSEQIQGRLRKKSPWYTSIINPLQGAGCKIPDETGEETGTVQIVERLTFSSAASGTNPTTGGMQISSPYINLGNTATTNTTGVNYQVTNTTDTPTSINFGNGTNNGFTYGTEFSGAGSFRSIAGSHRVVSCCLMVEHEASLSNNQGEICLYAIPFGYTTAPAYNTYKNLYSSITVPLNQNKPAMIRWFPIAKYDSNSAEVISYKSFLTPTFTTPPAWTLGVLCSGCVAGVIFRVTMVVNYEFLPLYNTLNILSVSPSPVDVEEEALVGKWVETMPVAATVSDKLMSSSPGAVSPQHGDEPTGLGMIANVIGEVLPFISMLL